MKKYENIWNFINFQETRCFTKGNRYFLPQTIKLLKEIDTFRSNYQELLKDFGVVIGGGETIRELVSLIEEHIGELS